MHLSTAVTNPSPDDAALGTDGHVRFVDLEAASLTCRVAPVAEQQAFQHMAIDARGNYAAAVTRDGQARPACSCCLQLPGWHQCLLQLTQNLTAELAAQSVQLCRGCHKWQASAADAPA